MLVRLVTVLAPVAILAIWGGSYVWACVVVLSAPGKPIEFRYRSNGGTLRLAAESYSIDWRHGTVYAGRPSVFGPDGGQLAAADRMDASGISFPLSGSILVRVRGAKGTLTRLPTGHFDIENYLWERKGPPSAIPYAVLINRADVTIVDRFGPTPYSQPAIARDIEVRGVGDSWVANGDIEVPGSGNLRAEVQSVPKEGLLIRGTTVGLKLASLVEHLKATPDVRRFPFLKDFRASTLETIGPISVFLPEGKDLRLSTRLRAIGTGIRYLNYVADQADFDGNLNDSGAQGELNARYGATKGKFVGSFVWQKGFETGGQLHVDTPSSAVDPLWLRELIPSQISFADAHLDGWFGYRRDDGVRLEASVSARQTSLFGQTVDQPKVALTLADGQARVGIAGGRWAGAPLHGAVFVGLKTPSLSGAISADSMDLASAGRKFDVRGLSGKAQVSLLLGGTRTSPTALLQASGTGSYGADRRLITGTFQVAGNYTGDQLIVDRLRIGTDAGDARAIGTVWVRKKTLSLKVDANSLRLEKLREDLIGSISASGVVSGALADPRFDGHAMALDVQASGQEIPFASAAVKADRHQVVATDLRIIRGTGEAKGQASVNLKTHDLSGVLSAGDLLLNEYLGEGAQGTVTVPKLTIGGTYDEPHLAGTAYGTDLVIGGVRVDRADIVSSLRGPIANIESLTARIGDGTMAGSGTYDYATKIWDFAVAGDGLRLDRITPVGKGPQKMAGNLSGKARVTIPAGGTILDPRTWAGESTGAFRDVNLNDTGFGGGNWKLAYDGKDLTGNASIGTLERYLLLENVDFNPWEDTIRGDVSIMNGSLQDIYTSTRPFFKEISYDVRQRIDSMDGDIDATVAFSGPRLNPNIDVSVLEVHNL
ncbi:MAG: hypothetical protein ACHQ50_12905, partial [Fimbriimonadales bacterium]